MVDIYVCIFLRLFQEGAAPYLYHLIKQIALFLSFIEKIESSLVLNQKKKNVYA